MACELGRYVIIVMDIFVQYCEVILICGAFNYVVFVGNTIHEFKYKQYKIPTVRLSNARFTLNHVTLWYEPLILQVCVN